MTVCILDTDHLTLLQHAHTGVTKQALSQPPEWLAITVVTVEEQLGGWYAQIRKARKIDQQQRAYEGLSEVVNAIQLLRVLPFSRAALERHVELKKEFRRIGRRDLAIAAIVLENNATLVTRNRVDFEQIPGLRIEDWSA